MEILYILTAVLLLMHPEASAEAAGVACSAMKTVVVRSLFPMMVLSRLISHSPLSERLCKRIADTHLWRRLKISDSLLPAVLSGYLSGLPVTALETRKLLSDGRITAREGEKAVCLASLPSPAFVILVASPSLASGVIRYAVLVITAYLTALLFPSTKSKGEAKSDPLSLTEAIASSTSSALSVSANIVFFSALTCSFSAVLPLAKSILAVLLEMGSAVALVGGNETMMVLVIGWCGLSAMSQIKSASPTLSVIPYAVTRCISCLSLLILQYFGEFLQNIL